MATPTKQELDQINALLNDIQTKYDQLGKENPFKGFDSKGIKNASSTIKQLETSLKGVSSEVRDINDEFNNTFKSLQSIVSELTKGKAATNKVVNSTKSLEDISSRILSQRNRGIKLDSKELMSLQKKSDLNFSVLKQNKPFIEDQIAADEANLKNAQRRVKELKTIKSLTEEQVDELKDANKEVKDTNASLEKNKTALGNINTMLDKNTGFQSGINSGLKKEILDRKTIEDSVGITGGLLTSLSKVTGITGIIDINKIKSDAEEVAQASMDAFRETEEYITKKQTLDVEVDDAKTALLGLSGKSKLSGEELESLAKDLEELNKIKVNIPVDANPKQVEELNFEINSLKAKAKGVDLEMYLSEKSNLEDKLNKASKGLDELEDEARSTTNSMSSQFSILGSTMGSVFEGLTNAIKSPEVIFAALIAAASEVNTQIVALSKSLSLSYKESQKLRGEFQEIADSANDTFISSKKLLEANAEFNKILGFQGEITAKNSQTFTELTKQLGVSVETATQLQLIAEATGEDFEKQKLEQYETVNAVSQQFGVSLDVKQVMEEVGKAGAYGLAQFQGSVTALTEGVAQAKALGISLDQVNSIAGKLLDFESSINSELQAELLLGKDINLEKARLAALNNDQVTLMEEINREMGDFNDFSNMNRIQQEAMADAVGMTVDGLSEALLKQQYAGKTQKEITDLAGKEVADRVEMLTTQERFNASIEKMKDVFISIVDGPVGSLAKLISDILGNTTIMYATLGALAAGPLVNMVGSFARLIPLLKTIRFQSIGAAIANIFSGNAKFGPLGIAAAGAGVAALYGAMKTIKVDDFMSPGYGKRTLSTPEGTIAFNNKDTIVAGTNLDQNTVINQSNNLPSQQTVAPANNTRMESELRAIKKVLENIATKEGTVSMNGTKFGTVTAMNTYQIQ